MKSGKKMLLAVMLFAAIGICSTLSAANLSAITATESVTSGIEKSYGVQPYGLEEPMGYENYMHCITRKLGRGVSNVGFGALEILIRIYGVRFEEGGIAGLTYGTFSGIGYFIARELLGVMDIATFFAPLPFTPNDPIRGKGWGYGPVLIPEWVLTPENDIWNAVYTNTATVNKY